MSTGLMNWLDNRTGCRKLISALLLEHIPGGAKWRYVWGSCLAFVFSTQLITGLLLMTSYSPSASTAWSSVYFIQYEMQFGWFIRGLHHFGSQTMVVLLALHMVQVVLAGAQLAPREINWWLGLMLLGAVLGMSLTGYLLPWDQKGYWATQVATKIISQLPVIGPDIQKILLGGSEYGHHTVSRFFTLHVGLLPPLIVLLLIAHVAVFRRHGVTAPRNAQGEGWFWPDQLFRDTAANLVVFCVMIAALCGFDMGGHGHRIEGSVPSDSWDAVSLAGRYYGLGANLDAPADPTSDYPPRPEWYFLFLFQMLKYFEGSHEAELMGTIGVPLIVGSILLIMPLLGYGRMRPFGWAAGVLFVFLLLSAVLFLTGEAIVSDKPEWAEKLGMPEQTILAAKEYQSSRQEADQLARRAVNLADTGVPAQGPAELLKRDPLTQGPVLFKLHCSGCHNFGDLFRGGEKASDLAGFGTKEWILGLLTDPDNPKYLKNTGFETMIQFVKDEGLSELADSQEKQELDMLASWLAGHPSSQAADRETAAFNKGRELFQQFGCSDCHRYEGEGGEVGEKAPDLTGYGSPEWIRAMIMSPNHPSRYGAKNKMPIFADKEGPAWPVIKQLLGLENEENVVQLSAIDRELLIRWVVGDDRLVYGGDQISAPPSEEPDTEE